MTALLPRAVDAHAWAREEHEHYVEPTWCSRRLFDVEQFSGPVWDPFCGFGRIIAAACAAGYPAHGSDIVCRNGAFPTVRDFFTDPGVDGIHDIVSNPPFDRFEEAVERALTLVPGKVAMIWLVRRLNAAKWLQSTPLARVLLLTPRPSMPPGHVIAADGKVGGGKQDFCWLVFDRLHSGSPAISWLHRDGEVSA